jgi:hypothetical protein
MPRKSGETGWSNHRKSRDTGRFRLAGQVGRLRHPSARDGCDEVPRMPRAIHIPPQTLHSSPPRRAGLWMKFVEKWVASARSPAQDQVNPPPLSSATSNVKIGRLADVGASDQVERRT